MYPGKPGEFVRASRYVVVYQIHKSHTRSPRPCQSLLRILRKHWRYLDMSKNSTSWQGKIPNNERYDSLLRSSSKHMLNSFAKYMSSDLCENLHSASTPFIFSSKVIDAVREQSRRFFGADSLHFDLVITACHCGNPVDCRESSRDVSRDGNRDNENGSGQTRRSF